MRPCSVTCGTRLAALILEDKLDRVVRVLRERCDLAGYPAELLVGEPHLGSLAVYVLRHGGSEGDETLFPTFELADNLTAGHTRQVFLTITLIQYSLSPTRSFHSSTGPL